MIKLLKILDSYIQESEKPNIRKQTRVLVVKNDKIAVIKKHGTNMLPGGGVNTGESPKHCAYRETREEINLNTQNLKLLKTKKYIYPDIYEGRDIENLDKTHKEWLEKQQRNGNITYFFVAFYKNKTKKFTGGPKDDKYKETWISIDDYINDLKKEIKKEKIEWIIEYLGDLLEVAKIIKNKYIKGE